jgi:hypothetical protein
VGALAGVDRKAQLLGAAVPVVDCGLEDLLLRLMLEDRDVLSLGLASGRGILGDVLEAEVVPR